MDLVSEVDVLLDLVGWIAMVSRIPKQISDDLHFLGRSLALLFW